MFVCVGEFSTWVRRAALELICASADLIGPAAAHTRILPLLEPFLKYDIVFVDKQSLLPALKEPFSKFVAVKISDP